MEYYQAVRKGKIYVCEAADCQDETHFAYHKEPHVFVVIEEKSKILPYCPACPLCGSSDNVYEHAECDIKTTKVLNEDD